MVRTLATTHESRNRGNPKTHTANTIETPTERSYAPKPSADLRAICRIGYQNRRTCFCLSYDGLQRDAIVLEAQRAWGSHSTIAIPAQGFIRSPRRTVTLGAGSTRRLSYDGTQTRASDNDKSPVVVCAQSEGRSLHF